MKIVPTNNFTAFKAKIDNSKLKNANLLGKGAIAVGIAPLIELAKNGYPEAMNGILVDPPNALGLFIANNVLKEEKPSDK